MASITVGFTLLAVGCTQNRPVYEPKSTLPGTAFRTPTQHDSVMDGRTWPYVLEIQTEAGSLLYYGSRHTSDPEDPQIEDMIDRWRQLEPTVVLAENTGGRHLPGFRRAIQSLGEFSVANHMADESRIPVWSLEPSWEDEIAYTLEVFTPEEATVFYTLRVFISERGEERSEESINDLARHLLRKRGSRSGLEGAIPDLETFDAVWRDRFDDPRDWRELPVEALWPGHRDTKLQALARRTNLARDQHFVRTILDMVRDGERVFAIAGGSHVVNQQPVLEAGLADLSPEVTVHVAEDPDR